MTRFKWTSFYQEFEVPVYNFLFKSAVLIVTTRNGGHIPTENKNIILSYPYTTQDMVESHHKILWDNNSGAGLEIHSTSGCHNQNCCFEYKFVYRNLKFLVKASPLESGQVIPVTLS